MMKVQTIAEEINLGVARGDVMRRRQSVYGVLGIISYSIRLARHELATQW